MELLKKKLENHSKNLKNLPYDSEENNTDTSKKRKYSGLKQCCEIALNSISTSQPCNLKRILLNLINKINSELFQNESETKNDFTIESKIKDSEICICPSQISNLSQEISDSIKSNYFLDQGSKGQKDSLRDQKDKIDNISQQFIPIRKKINLKEEIEIQNKKKKIEQIFDILSKFSQMNKNANDLQKDN